VSDDRVSVLVFYGDHARSAPERLVSGGCAAAARDLVDLALGCPLVDRVVVATNAPSFARTVPESSRVVVEVDPPGQAFHFGRLLQSLIEKHGIRRPLYFGAAAAPLLSAAGLEAICARLLTVERTVLSNNQGSADFYGFSPVEALRRVPLPDTQDNNLPYLLSRPGGGLRSEVLEPAIEHSFDVDTPTDLAVLAVQSSVKPHAKRYITSTGLRTDRLEAAMPRLLGRHSQVTLIGRVNTALWGKAQSDIPGPKRLYVEERNMKSFGRDVRGEARTILADLYQALGARRFFAKLAEYSDVVLFDTRVLLYHLCSGISQADRFSSDLGEVAAIQHPLARDFTAAAIACDVPVILGGHNIVSGALWALVQEAWDRADAGLIVAPPDAAPPAPPSLLLR
jgi:hypothetical protein